MKRAGTVSFVFLFGAIFGVISLAAQAAPSYGTAGMEGLGAQNGSGPSAQGTPAQLPPAKAGCPVSLRAQHGADGNIVKVDKNRPKGVAQLLHLSMVNPDSRRIVRATVRVRGVSGKGRVTQTPASPDGADVARTLEVRFAQGTDKEAAGDLWVPGMTAVLSIELNSVSFADGATWKFAAVDGCRFTPEHMMLVADR